MNIRVFLVSITIAGAMFAGTALAQAPKSPSETQWQQFLAKHPNVQAGLVNDPKYLAKHNGIAKWLKDHPAVSAYASQQNQIGGWDKNNQWHDRNWWVHNDPAWVHEHHPAWAEEQAQTRYVQEGGHPHHWWRKHEAEAMHNHHHGWYESEEHHGHHSHSEDHYGRD